MAKHKASHYWECHKCGEKNNVQCRCRRCGCLYKDSRLIKSKNVFKASLSPEKAEKIQEKIVVTKNNRRKKERINVRQMVKQNRKRAIDNFLAVRKNNTVSQAAC
jgi:hypothetical protein